MKGAADMLVFNLYAIMSKNLADAQLSFDFLDSHKFKICYPKRFEKSLKIVFKTVFGSNIPLASYLSKPFCTFLSRLRFLYLYIPAKK